MNHSMRYLAVGGFALIALVTGCGDDDTLSTAEFTEQANAICAEGDLEIGAAVGAVFGAAEPSPEQMQEALDTIVSVSNRQLDDIEALEEPSSMSDDVEAMVAEGRSGTEIAENQGLGFFEDDGDPWEQTQQLAVELGLDACAGE